MNRFDFQELAELRIREGKVLLDGGYHSGAYYLLGYAVECALKACILRQIRSGELPDRGFERNFYQHNLNSLLEYSGLKSGLTSDPDRNINWGVVKDWSEQARYDSTITDSRARDFYAAVTDSTSGVLT